LADTLLAHADLLVLLRRHEEAAHRLDELTRLVSPAWPNYPDAVVLLARCMQLAAAPDQPRTPQRAEQVRTCGARVPEMLRQAAAQEEGSPHLLALTRSNAFDLFRQRDEFRGPFRDVVSKLADRSRLASDSRE